MNSVKLRIPATTANMGPGFDVAGCALNLYNYLTVSISEKESFTITGLKDETLALNKNNLIYIAMEKVFNEVGIKMPPLEIHTEINIPLSRGLGSSSSAIIGGVVAGNRLTGNRLSKEKLLQIATRLEGHPDNVAPCLFGGLVISMTEKEEVFWNKINTSMPLSFIVVIPEFKLSTEEARSILPRTVSLDDAVFNLGHLAFLISAFLQNKPDLLKFALKDQLHEPFRGGLIPGFEDARQAALESGAIGTVISGAGPTILTLATENEYYIADVIRNKFAESGIKATYKILEIDNDGTVEI